MADIYLLTGGNLGDRQTNLSIARNMIVDIIGQLSKSSSVYETEPWGFNHDSKFLNQALLIKTEKNPDEILKDIETIETIIGRKRSGGGYEARNIDIDILFYDNMILSNEKLVIPQKYIEQRKFILVPLAEIAPDLIHPVFQKSIKDLLQNCQDKLEVRRYN